MDFPANDGFIKKIPIIGRFDLRQLLSAHKGQHTSLALVLIAVLVSLIAYQLGFHPAVGAYMAGLIIHKNYFKGGVIRNNALYERSKHIIDNVAFSWFGPVFFVALGSKMILDSQLILSILPQALLFLLDFL